MNGKLPPFENGEYNSESASTVDRDITLNSVVAAELSTGL